MTDMKKNIKRTAVLSVVLVLMFAITVFGAEQTEEYVPAVYATFWALVPPVVAIGLALVTKEVYSSLFIGVAVGAMLYSGFNPWESFVNFFDIMKNSMNLNILIFDVLLGMIIVLMAKSGGSAAYGRWAGTKIKSKKSALLATTGLGMLIL